MKKYIKTIATFISTFLIMLMMISSVSYASTNYRFLSEEEISAYNKFEINSSNIDNLRTTRIVNASEKVYDYGNLFTTEEEQEIYNAIQNFIQETNMDFVVVTLMNENATDYSDENFADDFYDYNDFGIGSTRDGILCLVDLRNDVSGNRYVYYSTTGNGILYYDDERIDSLVSIFIYNGDASAGYGKAKYAHGILQAIQNALYYYDDGIPYSNRDAWIDENGDYHYQIGHARSLMTPFERIKESLFAIIVIDLIAVITFFIINANKLKNKKIASSAKIYLKKDSLNFTKSEDTFLTTHTTSYKMSSDSSSGCGGSSSHSSSSGSSHGGGGGHF